MSNLKPTYVFAAIMLLSIGLHWNVWNSDILGIHAWRQTQTMSVVENFVQEDMNILNPRINPRGSGDGIFRMEFPLMQWIFAWGYKLFGSKLIVARILSFLISLFSILGFYKYLRTWNLDQTKSALGAWCFAWSPVLFFYAVNPLPDNLALCFAIWSLVFLKRHSQTSSAKSLFGFAVFLSLATAVKLPFILFGAGYIPMFMQRLKSGKLKESITQTGVLLLIMTPALAWYAWVIPQWTNTALIGGVGVENSFDFSSAISTIWGTIHSTLPELFINFGSVLFFLFGMGLFLTKRRKWASLNSELAILAFVILYFLYEVNMIGMEHDYYLFPFLPFIFLCVTAGIGKVIYHQQKWLAYLGLIALIILPLTAYLRICERWSGSGTSKALVEHKHELQNLIPENALVVAGNDASTHIVLYHLNRKGWTFEQDWLFPESLKTQIEEGAEFLFINSNRVETTSTLKELTQEPIFEKDGLTVYPLVPSSDF
ncbi:MAG: ArnT family glycosyltransferase [Flavobacteriales bacterium]